MKRLSAILLVLLIASGTLFAGGQAEEDDGVITVGTDATWPPMEFVNEDQELVGFDIDLMNAIADAAGFEVEFQNTAWDGIFAGLASGDYDAVISSVTITEERQETMDFSEPYLNAGQVLVVPADGPEGVTDLASEMSDATLGAQIGTTGAILVQEAGLELRTYDEIGLAIEDLANGRIDGVVADTPIAADYALQNENYSDSLKIGSEAFTEELYGVAVNKGNDEVLSMINEGLEIVREDGTIEDLEEKWLR
ncbi:MAG: basic amino acid ABC transporter substrate-binding protein [Alkalispirochaetaceae bacterium]